MENLNATKIALIIILGFSVLALVIFGFSGCKNGYLISQLKSGEDQYALVNEGDSVLVPYIDSEINQAPNSISDYFGVLAILGVPNSKDYSLTDFTKNEIWLLVESYGESSKRFIIVLKCDPSLISESTFADLKLKFEQGGFWGNEDSNVLSKSEPWYYLYFEIKDERVRYDYPEIINYDYYGYYLRLDVNRKTNKSPISATLFASAKKDGKLLIIIDATVPMIAKDRQNVAKIKPIILEKLFVKCRPNVDKALPKLQ